MLTPIEVKTFSEYFELVNSFIERNRCKYPLWYRGQSDSQKPPIPSILRDNCVEHEFEITREFRLKAPAFGDTPETRRLDQWLILMQHFGAPTRLLDWTESPLAALFFAIQKFYFERNINSNPAIWILNPIELNRLTDPKFDDFPNTWTQSQFFENFKIPFGTAGKEVPYGPTIYPIAFIPSSVHARISSQKSCFSIHGTDKRDFEKILSETDMIKNGQFAKILIASDRVRDFLNDLINLGITFSSIYPDFEGLAKELRIKFS
jgi:hypothetical protein